MKFAIRTTLVIQFVRNSTRPVLRESQEWARLSPISRYFFGGIRRSVPRGRMSLSESVRRSRRSGWMYGSTSILPLM
jgi:hypothetical protein